MAQAVSAPQPQAGPSIDLFSTQHPKLHEVLHVQSVISIILLKPCCAVVQAVSMPQPHAGPSIEFPSYFDTQHPKLHEALHMPSVISIILLKHCCGTGCQRASNTGWTEH